MIGVAGGGFERDGGEGGGFAGLHGDAAEADGAAEGALDGGFEQVELAHGDAARGDDDVDGAEGGSEVLFEGAGSRMFVRHVIRLGVVLGGGDDVLVFGYAEI